MSQFWLLSYFASVRMLFFCLVWHNNNGHKPWLFLFFMILWFIDASEFELMMIEKTTFFI